jgi:tetratricopeptide (TPR) repeat protein
VPLRQIARDLGVDAVVEGSVLWSGERVRISAQLSHAPTDRTIWARSYERDLRDVLALQRELAEAITEEIRIKLTAEERARIRGGPPVDHVAYQAYLKGRYHFNKRTEADARQAIEHFQQALATHPTYAEAYTGLSSCYSYLSSVMGGRSPRDLRPLATAAARKALAIDDSLTEAHYALAAIQLATWEWAAAEQSLRRAIELDASSASAHGLLSHYFTLFGRTDEALAEARIAQSLDPFSARALWWEAMAFLNARRYDEAIATFRRSLELDPKYIASQWFLGVAHAEKGSFAEAVAAHERALELSGRGAAYLGSLGGVYARFGRKREALSLLEELNAAAARGYVTPAAFVFIHIGLGDRDRAFEWLNRAAEDQTELIKFLAVYPPLDPLRSDARFAVLLRRVGLPELSRNAA